MYQSIMVPLDGSELAERALPCAEELARFTGATLHLVRVVEPPATWSGASLAAPAYLLVDAYDNILRAETDAATTYLERLRGRIAATGAPVQAERLDGTVAAALLDYERTAGIDLVVMCSHGRSGLARFALGSVAERLLRHGSAPVLLVRAFGEPAILQRAVVPLDGSVAAETALDVVDQLARYVLHEVTLVRVITTPEQGPEAERYLNGVALRLQQEHLACRSHVEQGDPAQAIIDAAGADKLVVMATHGRSGLTRWALGSVADRVARGGAAAVLLVRQGSNPASL